MGVRSSEVRYRTKPPETRFRSGLSPEVECASGIHVLFRAEQGGGYSREELDTTDRYRMAATVSPKLNVSIFWWSKSPPAD